MARTAMAISLPNLEVFRDFPLPLKSWDQCEKCHCILRIVAVQGDQVDVRWEAGH